jgi:hypothetical protein
MLALEGAAGETSRARSARLRERSYDVISDADLRDIGTYFGNDPGDLVTKHRRGWNDIVRGEEQVGVTQPGRLHVDENFVPNRRGDVYNLEVEPTTERVNYKRLHVWPPTVAFSRPSVPTRLEEEPWAGALPASRLAAFPESVWSLVSSCRSSHSWV